MRYGQSIELDNEEGWIFCAHVVPWQAAVPCPNFSPHRFGQNSDYIGVFQMYQSVVTAVGVWVRKSLASLNGIFRNMAILEERSAT